jgi:large subunit ribosomal protein L21
MFAVVEIAGQQHRVSPAERVFVPKLKAEVGSKITFDSVLLYSDDKNVKIGNPYIKGISVEAKVLGLRKDEEVTVFKKKKRKGYRLRRGHRQQLTEIEIMNIG